jgi:hypothetical protein
MLRNEKDRNDSNHLFLLSSFLLSLASAEVFATVIFSLVLYAEYIRLKKVKLSL